MKNHDYFMLEKMPEVARKKFLSRLLKGRDVEVRLDRDMSRPDADVFRVDFTDREEYQKILDDLVSTYN